MTNRDTTSAGTPSPRREPTVDDFVNGIAAGNRTLLARAITLVESRSQKHAEMAQEVLQRVIPRTGRAKRVGITGVPGVGKSTFIEKFGCYLCNQDHKLAVLAIDPSSTRTRGSILGDKTRMEQLSNEPNAFIRPSPAGENLGGVARRTRETMYLCEAAGFDVVIVETVGVGQGEVALRSMVDFFLLLLLPGAGDELQGIKKGIVEMADAVLINKADGENRQRAERAKVDQAAALHYLSPATPGWRPPVELCSGLTGEGIAELWRTIEKFYLEMGASGIIATQRQEQNLKWLEDLINEELRRRFHADPYVRSRMPELKGALASKQLTAVRAAQVLFEELDRCENRNDG